MQTVITSAEVEAAKSTLDKMADLAGRDQPVPDTLIRVMLEAAAKVRPVPDDVARLVVAARIVAFEDQSQEALKALDSASEAFACDVPWDKAR